MTDGGAAGPALLAVDIGNTNTVLGIWRGDRLARNWRLTTRRDATSDEIALSVRGLFAADALVEDGDRKAGKLRL